MIHILAVTAMLITAVYSALIEPHPAFFVLLGVVYATRPERDTSV